MDAIVLLAMSLYARMYHLDTFKETHAMFSAHSQRVYTQATHNPMCATVPVTTTNVLLYGAQVIVFNELLRVDLMPGLYGEEYDERIRRASCKVPFEPGVYAKQRIKAMAAR